MAAPPELPDIRLHAERLLHAYLERFPADAARLTRLREQVAWDRTLALRSNMTGHLTSSAAVLNPQGSRILLIDHAFLKKWLTPGGHYEAPGGLLESALREVAEETGVCDAVAHAWTLASGIPLDIDTHDIPANPRKGEGAHVHHDFLFVATALERDGLQAQLGEVHAAVWAPVAQLAASDDERVRRVLFKLRQIGAVAG